MQSNNSENRTKFHGNDPDADYATDYRLDGHRRRSDHYELLSLYNTGNWNGKWADERQRTASDKEYVMQIISARLELTDYQKRESVRYFNQLDVAELSSPGGVDSYLVAICVAAVVARQDGRVFHPSRSAEYNDRLFESILNELGYDSRTVRSCFEKVRGKIDDGG